MIYIQRTMLLMFAATLAASPRPNRSTACGKSRP